MLYRLGCSEKLINLEYSLALNRYLVFFKIKDLVRSVVEGFLNFVSRTLNDLVIVPLPTKWRDMLGGR